MKKLITALFLLATPAAAQNYYYYQPTPFQQGYDAATNGFNNSMRNGAIRQQQRANEAMINLERRRQGLPPCTLASPLRAMFSGMPAC